MAEEKPEAAVVEAEKPIHVNCGDCIYWDIDGAERTQKGIPVHAQCRAPLPVVSSTVLSGTPEGQWPVTKAEQWCKHGRADPESLPTIGYMNK